MIVSFASFSKCAKGVWSRTTPSILLISSINTNSKECWESYLCQATGLRSALVSQIFARSANFAQNWCSTDHCHLKHLMYLAQGKRQYVRSAEWYQVSQTEPDLDLHAIADFRSCFALFQADFSCQGFWRSINQIRATLRGRHDGECTSVAEIINREEMTQEK